MFSLFFGILDLFHYYFFRFAVRIHRRPTYTLKIAALWSRNFWLVVLNISEESASSIFRVHFHSPCLKIEVAPRAIRQLVIFTDLAKRTSNLTYTFCILRTVDTKCVVDVWAQNFTHEPWLRQRELDSCLNYFISSQCHKFCRELLHFFLHVALIVFSTQSKNSAT
jgi:hypothetical protein